MTTQQQEARAWAAALRNGAARRAAGLLALAKLLRTSARALGAGAPLGGREAMLRAVARRAPARRAAALPPEVAGAVSAARAEVARSEVARLRERLDRSQ